MRSVELRLVAFLAIGLGASVASAQNNQWLDGSFGFEPGLACVTWTSETAVTSFAGYWGSPTAAFPQTGDTTYVRGVAAVVGNPCAGADVIGFDFELPLGAALSITAQNPVVCLATRLADGFTTTTDPNIHCSQEPSIGDQGGLFFGYATVPHGWMFEIRVPVAFDRENFGIGGFASDNLKVAATSTNGVTVVEAWVLVPYRALVNYPSPSTTYLSGDTYRVTTFVYNYFTAGTAHIDASGTPGGPYGDYATANITDTDNGFAVSYDLTVTPGYTYYWRVRFETAGGTFVGPEQLFYAGGSTPAIHALGVSKAGAGSGTVRSDPQGLTCGETCSLDFTSGSLVSLSAEPDPGSTFAGWSDACTGTGACDVTMTAANTVTATFDVAIVPTIGELELTVAGLPVGAVASIAVTGPQGFNQTFDILSGTGQALSSAAVGEYVGIPGNVLSGDTYVARPARVTAAVLGGGTGLISANYQVGRLLSLTHAGAGTGAVVSSPGGLSCGASCAVFFASAEQVTLSAAPQAGSTFAGWGGACAGTGDCVVVMGTDQAVTATFEPAAAGSFTLTVERDGTGFGSVGSVPAGIACGVACNFNFAAGTPVTLTATPADGSSFSGWGGACAGTGTCALTVNAATTATAVFDLPGTPSYALAAQIASQAPTDGTAAKGDARVVVLAFDLDGSEVGELDGITLAASGTGHDALDLTAVEVFEDSNGNGALDAGEEPLATGTLAADDGTLVLSPTSPQALADGTTHFLVAVSVNTTLDGGVTAPPASDLRRHAAPWLLAWLLSLVAAWVCWPRRRTGRAWLSLAAGAIALLGACGGGSTADDDGGTADPSTFTLTLTEVDAHANIDVPNVTGLPIVGATLSVQP